MAETQASTKLIEQAIAGDAVSLQRLLLGHFDRLAAHIHRRLSPAWRPHISAEDVLQETFIQAIRDIGRCQAATPQSFGAWLNALAENRLRDTIKRLSAEKRKADRQRAAGPADGALGTVVDWVALVADNGGTPSQSVARHEAVAAVRLGIACLPADQRQAVELHFIGGQTVEQTAEAMDRTPGAVRGLLQRARQALRHTLEQSTLWFSRK